MSNRRGYRGYIASRPVRGLMQPQQVQNLVVRDYAARRRVTYLLSATEYAMPACYLILETVMRELPEIKGVICYSLFMLPERAARRRELYERIFAAGCSLHGALENMAVVDWQDVAALEDIFLVDRIAARAVPPELVS